MLDIKFVRENPEVVKENIKKKFQDQKLPLVDEVIDIDAKIRSLKVEGENLKAQRNTLSKQIGQLMREKKIDEANEIKALVSKNNERIAEIDPEIVKLEEASLLLIKFLSSTNFFTLIYPFFPKIYDLKGILISFSIFFLLFY